MMSFRSLSLLLVAACTLPTAVHSHWQATEDCTKGSTTADVSTADSAAATYPATSTPPGGYSASSKTYSYSGKTVSTPSSAPADYSASSAAVPAIPIATEPSTTPPGDTSTTSTDSGTSTVTGGGSTGYATYHSYSADQSTSTIACSDGANGLQAKGYSTLAGLYPNVAATSFISWNSDKCGSCWRLTNPQTGNSVSITAIDACGPVGGYDTHFDLAQPAFAALGGTGIAAGHLVVEYSAC